MAGTLTHKALADSVDRRLLIVLALVYLFTARGYIEVSDTSYSLQTAEAIVSRGRLDIQPAAGATLTAADGLSYSKYGVGLPLAYVPLVALSHLPVRPARLPPLDLALSFTHISLLTEVLTVINIAAIFHNTA